MTDSPRTFWGVLCLSFPPSWRRWGRREQAHVTACCGKYHIKQLSEISGSQISVWTPREAPGSNVGMPPPYWDARLRVL